MFDAYAFSILSRVGVPANTDLTDTPIEFHHWESTRSFLPNAHTICSLFTSK